MRNTFSNVVGWVRSHPVASAVLVALFAPGFIFGFVFQVLGLIGWGRVIMALAVLAGWFAHKFFRSQVLGYKQTADDAISLAREVKNEFYR